MNNEIIYTAELMSKYIEDIRQIVQNNPRQYCSVIRRHDAKCIDKLQQYIPFINSKTPLLQLPSYKLATKIYWLLNNITDFPICPVCNNKFGYNINVTFSIGYTYCCSRSCSGKLSHTDKAKTARKKTTLLKYGVTHTSQAPTVKQKRKITCLDKYGVDEPFKLAHIQLAGNIAGNAGWYDPKRKQKRLNKSINTCLKRYGVKHYRNSEKALETNRLNHKGLLYAQTPASAKYRKKRVKYDNLTFDSSWEVIVYKYCKEHNMQCEYQPTIAFKYTYANKTRYYHPDFLIEGQLYEIKGDHFFKEDGTMQNPFNHKLDALYEAKHQCMINNNVKIIRYADLQNLQAVISKTYLHYN